MIELKGTRCKKSRKIVSTDRSEAGVWSDSRWPIFCAPFGAELTRFCSKSSLATIMNNSVSIESTKIFIIHSFPTSSMNQLYFLIASKSA